MVRRVARRRSEAPGCVVRRHLRGCIASRSREAVAPHHTADREARLPSCGLLPYERRGCPRASTPHSPWVRGVSCCAPSSSRLLANPSLLLLYSLIFRTPTVLQASSTPIVTAKI